jgi:hypothetical protein
MDVHRTTPICLVCVVMLTAGCSSSRKKVEDAVTSAQSWAATVKVVTEQWAQSRVSLRFTRTTLETAVKNLTREAESIRSIDPASAAAIDRLNASIGPVMDAVARNEPDDASTAAKQLPAPGEPAGGARR